MAIEIIPKGAIKKSAEVSYLFYFSIALVIAALLIWIVSIALTKNSNTTLEKLEAALRETKSPEKQALEAEVLAYKEKLENFSKLLDSHRLGSNFFTFLESSTHPKVSLVDLKSDFVTSKASLSGKTDTFRSLGQEVLFLQGNKNIQDLKLTKTSFGKEGAIEFTIDFSFNPKVLFWRLE